MSFAEQIILGLIIFAFVGFGVTLAAVSWYERSWAEREAHKPRAQRRRSDAREATTLGHKA